MISDQLVADPHGLDQNIQEGFDNVDLKELSRNLQDQLFKQHKFEKATLFLMIVHFLINV